MKFKSSQGRNFTLKLDHGPPILTTNGLIRMKFYFGLSNLRAIEAVQFLKKELHLKSETYQKSTLRERKKVIEPYYSLERAPMSVKDDNDSGKGKNKMKTVNKPVVYCNNLFEFLEFVSSSRGYQDPEVRILMDGTYFFL